MPAWLSTLKTAPNPMPVASIAGEQHVRVGVADVLVDAPAAADDVLAVAADVVGEADARLPVVAVFLRLLADILEPLDAVEQAGRARGLHLHEVRIQRLIDLEAGDEVVAQADVDRQPVGDAPVVLDVEARTASSGMFADASPSLQRDRCERTVQRRWSGACSCSRPCRC